MQNLHGTSPFTEKRDEARFIRRTFYEPNLIRYIKYMKSSMSESIRNASFNLEQLSRSFRLARPGISTLEPLWFRRRFFQVHIAHFESSLAEGSIFHFLNLSQLELRSASESIQAAKIIWVELNNSNYKVRLTKSSGSEQRLIRKKKKPQKCLQFIQKGNPLSCSKASTTPCFHKMIHFRHVLDYFLLWQYYAGQDTGAWHPCNIPFYIFFVSMFLLSELCTAKVHEVSWQKH